jgi:hypothetical protein
LLYLDDFSFSRVKIFKYIQIFSLIFIPLYVIYYLYYTPDLFLNVIFNIKEGKDINLHGHVSLDKEAAQILGNSINTVGSNIGLGASVAGISAAVGKALAKSSLPPLQKAAIIIGGGAIGGLIHSGFSHINRANASLDSIVYKKTLNNLNDSINKFVDESSTSPLEGLLFSIHGINSICFTLMLILVLQLFIRFYIKEDVKVN